MNRTAITGLFVGLLIPATASAQYIIFGGNESKRNERPAAKAPATPKPEVGTAWQSEPPATRPPAVAPTPPPRPPQVAAREPVSAEPVSGRCPGYVADASEAADIVKSVLGFSAPINHRFDNRAKGDSFTLVDSRGRLNARLTGTYNTTVDAEICHADNEIHALLYGRSVKLKISKVSNALIRITDKSTGESGLFRSASAK